MRSSEVSQDILIARPDVRRTMGLPDLVLPVNAGFLANLVSKEPVNSLTFSQAVAEHEQMLGQLKALMAIRDYIPMHIYNSASGHLFGPEELKGSPTGPQLRPEYATLRAYAAGNIELCKSLFAELDRHMHEVLAPRLDELGMLRYGQDWPQPPQHFRR
ncbi:hypothetical protein CVIRNUC_010643 [Coccomyxa viridis]|uniref:Uncharacterized protein n=1 Tax=Coccomyxa viridis TaxID=1274662 RepID=A0AAV1IN15_9CHLO|nr:hypothetical protein CVIRNUC_010643 [Coccomyxa viridis]